MLDSRFVADNLDQVRTALVRRNPAWASELEPVADLVRRRREALGLSEKRAGERNVASTEMAKADKSTPAFAEQREALKALSNEVKALEKQVADIEAELEQRLLGIPNMPLPSVPDGKGAEDNVVVRTWGEPKTYDFVPKPHWEIGEGLGLLDFERAAKLSGPRFTVLFGDAARLERALIHFMLEVHTREHGYTEVLPPFLVKDTALLGTGQLPKFADDLFKTHKADPERSYELYLIPTGEVPVTNLHASEILEGEKLPISYTAYTPCFRAEAGSHGRDVRGLIRQHQFDKVELVKFTTPEESEAEHEKLTANAEEILKRLGLHFRTVLLCAGDMGAGSCKTYDLEVYLPSEKAFREISSCSNFGDYQARRAQIRFRPAKEGDAKPKVRLAHTLNGSGLAVGRTLIAIFDQYQQADGTVVVPEVLRSFMGCDVINKR